MKKDPNRHTFFSGHNNKCPYDNCTFQDLKISFLQVKRFILRNVNMALSQKEAEILSEMAEITTEITGLQQQLFLAKLASRAIQSHNIDKIRGLIACAVVEKIDLIELQSLKAFKPGDLLRIYAEVRFQVYFIAAIENAENELLREQRTSRVGFV
ncbi:MAG: hypothetical protein Q8L78_08210 [Coxiellaceae bacterium]|nr:hypothetical protein [Coxiellaceae bacterium]